MKTVTGLTGLFTAIVVIMSFSANAWAYLMSDTGSLDTFQTSAALNNSGYGTQEMFIENFLGQDIIYTKLDDNSSGESGNWQEVTDDGINGTYAYFFGSGIIPEYYLIKTGNLMSQTDDTFLFLNNDNKEYAYVNIFADFGVTDPRDINIEKFSHVGFTGGNTVPEPAALALLGLGLLGIGLARRYRA